MCLLVAAVATGATTTATGHERSTRPGPARTVSAAHRAPARTGRLRLLRGLRHLVRPGPAPAPGDGAGPQPAQPGPGAAAPASTAAAAPAPAPDTARTRHHPRHAGHHRAQSAPRRQRLTEERPFFEVVGSLLGIDVGLTLSEINRVRGDSALELVHVVDQTGSAQNFELVLARRELTHGQRIEFQGPALNTQAGVPLGFRALGLGLTSDLFEPGQRRALSYTLEAKLTERALLYWSPVFAPGLARGLERVLGVAGSHPLAGAVAGALPLVSAALAVQSAVRAVKVFRSPDATRVDKALAAGHAVADAIRVGMPLVGTLANVGLVAVSAGIALAKLRHLGGGGARLRHLTAAGSGAPLRHLAAGGARAPPRARRGYRY